MRYLGGISGNGVLKHDGAEIARTFYDFDGYYKSTTGVMSCGEIKLSAEALKGVFALNGLQLLTDDGRLLNLTFSERKLPEASNVAHVDVTGELPACNGGWPR